MMANIYYSGNDHLLDIVGLQNEAAGVYLNSATVTVTVKDSTGVEIAGETWPLSASYVSGSNGDYRATLADTLTVVAGARYVAEVDADGGVGLKGFWRFPFTVRERIT